MNFFEARFLLFFFLIIGSRSFGTEVTALAPFTCAGRFNLAIFPQDFVERALIYSRPPEELASFTDPTFKLTTNVRIAEDRTAKGLLASKVFTPNFAGAESRDQALQVSKAILTLSGEQDAALVASYLKSKVLGLLFDRLKIYKIILALRMEKDEHPESHWENVEIYVGSAALLDRRPYGTRLFAIKNNADPASVPLIFSESAQNFAEALRQLFSQAKH